MARTLKEMFEDQWEMWEDGKSDFEHSEIRSSGKADYEKMFDQLAERIHAEKNGGKNPAR